VVLPPTAFCPEQSVLPGTLSVSSALARDVTDTKWLAIALEADADYLVTLDRRHLQRLKSIGQTKNVSPRAFLRALDRSEK